MSTSPDPPPIHSLAEARLYLMVTPCHACGAGPLTPVPARTEHDEASRLLAVNVRCQGCGQTRELTFDARQIAPPASWADLEASLGAADPAVINPTDEPSKIIDLAGWLTLHSVIVEVARAAAVDARSPNERARVRQMQIEAGLCLDEALKFYDADNELPPEDAFFEERSRGQFRRRPESFARERLIELRRALPQARRQQEP